MYYQYNIQYFKLDLQFKVTILQAAHYLVYKEDIVHLPFFKVHNNNIKEAENNLM